MAFQKDLTAQDKKRVDTCHWTAIIAAMHAQETTQTLYISIFWLPISCTLRLIAGWLQLL